MGHFDIMINYRDYIKYIRSSGHFSFTTDEAMSYLGVSRNAFNCGMYKLRKKGEIVSPAKNLYVIVPPEYQAIGCIPAEELLPILMKYLNVAYYGCLLSAALYHGASHQKPQVFQVMTDKQLKTVNCGKVRIDFIYKKSLANLPTQNITVKTGYLTIATPELTAMDLLNYPRHVGGVNHIATVLSELIEKVDPILLIKLVHESAEKSWVQRLGYILEKIDSMDEEKQQHIADLLYQSLAKPLRMVPLVPELQTTGNERNPRWMIIENTNIESDL